MSVNIKSMHHGQITAFRTPGAALMGEGAVREVPAQLKRLGGRKPLVITDQGIVQAGILKQVTDILSAASIPYALYDRTVRNPTDVNVTEAAALYANEKCDCLLTVGGGSTHDCGKGVGFLVSNGGKLQDYEGVDKSTKPFPPLVAVNTTAGSASEMSRYCMITDTARRVKLTIADNHCIPAVAISDVTIIMNMPADVTVSASMAALTRAVEAYVSTDSTPFTDACVEKAMEFLGIYTRRGMSNLKDQEAREGLCYAQSLTGIAASNAGMGLTHAMAHQLGAFYDLPHGECCGVLLPHVCQYNLISNRRRYAWLASLMGERTEGLSSPEAPLRFIAALQILSNDIGLPQGLVALGTRHGKQVRAEDMTTMAGNALKDICCRTNTRDVSAEAIAGIYKAAL